MNACRDGGLIAVQSCGFVDGMGIEPSKLEVGPGADYQEGGAPRQPIYARIIDVAAIHDIEFAGFRDQFGEHPDIVPFAVADANGGPDSAPQVQQRVEFDGPLWCAETLPRGRPTGTSRWW